MTESDASYTVRVLVKLAKVSRGKCSWEQLLELAKWMGENIPRETLGELMKQLEEIDDGHDGS